jgi:hypothetical protein
LFLGVCSGIVCGVTGLEVEGIVVGIVLYGISVLTVFFTYNIPLRSISQNREFYTVGLGTYLAIWFTVWILVNTIAIRL